MAWLLELDGSRPTIVGSRVTVGHGALLEGCVIEDEAPIGSAAEWTRSAADDYQQLRRRYLAREETPWKQPC